MQNKNLKISLVIPWFGRRSGGAEYYCLGLARALADAGHDIEVLATTCKDPFSNWSSSHYQTGIEEFGNFIVRRFTPDKRNADIYVQHELKIRDGKTLSAREEYEWSRNSINSTDMMGYIGNNRQTRNFIFMPYLYGTTITGIETAGTNGWLLPCLHNEAAAYFKTFDKIFSTANGCFFLSQPEMEFAKTRYQLPQEKCALICGGIDPITKADPETFKQKYKIKNPYLLYVGRVVPGKGADLLAQCYLHSIDKLENPPDLVLIGEGETISDPSGKIHSLGYLSDEDVHSAAAGCLAFCQPSWYESFSIVLLDAWQRGRPAIVNAYCDVTREHCRQSNGGLWFADSNQFRHIVQWLIDNPEKANQLGQNGQQYVQQHFNWTQTVKAIESQLNQHPKST